MEEGETGLGWIVREGTVKKSIQGGEEKLDTCHQSQQRLEERGWGRINTVSGIRKEGGEVKMTDIKKQLGGVLFNNIPLINYAFLKNQQKGELLKEEDGVMCS